MAAGAAPELPRLAELTITEARGQGVEFSKAVKY